MRLETEYGTLHGTTEEFKELLEGEPIRGNFNKGYKVVKEDTSCFRNGGKALYKGVVLKHITQDLYEDTLGVQYIVLDRSLLDYNKGWVEDKFNRYKARGHLLLQADPFKHNYKNFALTELGDVVVRQVVVEDGNYNGNYTIQWLDTQGYTHKNCRHLELTNGVKKRLNDMFEDYKYRDDLLCKEDVVGLYKEDSIYYG